MPISNEFELQASYHGAVLAQEYVGERFSSELTRLLHDKQVSVINALIQRESPPRILEIAPGPGRLTRDVHASATLVCLEYNQGMIEEGRRACHDRAVWVRGNAFQIPFSEGFDLVYSFRFIRHFQRQDRERLYAQIRRVLNPGGHLVLDAINERVARPWRQAKPEAYPIYDELYNPMDLRAELIGAGLVPVQLTPVQRCYAWQRRCQIVFGPRVNWLNRLLIRSLERLPCRAEAEWVVTCRRA